MSSLALRRALMLGAATVLTACSEPVAVADAPTLPASLAANPHDANATVAWNRVAQDLVKKHGTSAPATIRLFALLTVSQYNAIVATEREKEQSLHPSDRAAVAGASAVVLSYIYPAEATALESLVDAQEAGVPPAGSMQEDFVSGEAIGRRVAGVVVDRAKGDRFFEPFTGTVPQCPSCWLPVPTPPAFATLGAARPFFLATNNQFRPAPHPAWGSPEFLAALQEVRAIADTRTVEQDSIAKYWALGPGTVSAQGYWNVIGSDLALRYRRSERETARVLALMNIAAFDAIIASHEAKYHYWLIRPSQADPGIVRAIGLPSFPAYPSNHSALAGASSTVLASAFPSERAWLESHAEEGAISRLYGGIHYRFDTEAGIEMGRRIAGWTLSHGVNGHEAIPLR